MTEIPEHLKRRAEEARKLVSNQAVQGVVDVIADTTAAFIKDLPRHLDTLSAVVGGTEQAPPKSVELFDMETAMDCLIRLKEGWVANCAFDQWVWPASVGIPVGHNMYEHMTPKEADFLVRVVGDEQKRRQGTSNSQ